MRINLLPEDKKPDSGAVSASGPRQVPMSTPVPIDGVATHQPITLTPSLDERNVENTPSVPVARKYSAIATEQNDSEDASVKRVESLPRLSRDRSGQVQRPVFAARRTDPSDSSENKLRTADNLPKAEKTHVPDEMHITKENSLDPSIKGNLLAPFNDKKVAESIAPIKDVELPKKTPATDVIQPITTPKLETKTPVVVRKDKRDWRPLFRILSILVAIIASVGLWWGIVEWQNRQITTLTARRDALSQQVEVMSADKDAGLRLQAQLDVANDWLKQSRDYSAVLRALEQSVLPTTTYVAVDVASVNSFVVRGEAGTMEDVAKQFSAFEMVDGVKESELLETNLQNGVASFAFSVTLVP